MVSTEAAQDKSNPQHPSAENSIAGYWNQLHASFRMLLLMSAGGGGAELSDYWDYDWRNLPPTVKQSVVTFMAANQEPVRGFAMCCLQIARDRLAP